MSTKTLLERLDEAAMTVRGNLGSRVHGLSSAAAEEIRALRQELVHANAKLEDGENNT